MGKGAVALVQAPDQVPHPVGGTKQKGRNHPLLGAPGTVITRKVGMFGADGVPLIPVYAPGQMEAVTPAVLLGGVGKEISRIGFGGSDRGRKQYQCQKGKEA